VTYPGFTPVGNATLVVANVLTCNKHSHIHTEYWSQAAAHPASQATWQHPVPPPNPCCTAPPCCDPCLVSKDRHQTDTITTDMFKAQQTRLPNEKHQGASRTYAPLFAQAFTATVIAALADHITRGKSASQAARQHPAPPPTPCCAGWCHRGRTPLTLTTTVTVYEAAID
jgi:hypothetical protein